MGLLPPVCAFGVPGQVKTHGSSGFETDLKNVGMFDSGLLAASVASDWPAAFIEPEVFVVAALNAVVWVIGRFVFGALMELAWETDHDDHVSTSAGTENVSIGNVFEMEGRCAVDFGLKTLVGCCCGRVFGLLSFRSSMFAQAPGCWAFVVAGGAAVALSHLLKMMTRQAAAAWAAAKEGLHVSEFLGAFAALALLGMHVKQIKHAAASTAAANDGWYVPESFVASVAGALKRHAIKNFALCHCSCLPRARVSQDSAGIGILHLGCCRRCLLVW